VKQFGVSVLVARLMTQVTAHRDLVCTSWLHLPTAAAGMAGGSTPGAMPVPCPACPRMPTAPALHVP